MNLTNLDIIGELERLAEACPWDEVDLWARRAPAGEYRFTAYVPDNEKFGFKSAFGNGDTPAAAVSDLIKKTGARSPEISREKAIAELREKIARLEAVVIGLPPYRPGRILSNGEAEVRVNPTVDV